MGIEKACQKLDAELTTLFDYGEPGFNIAKKYDGIIALGIFCQDDVECFSKACEHIVFVDHNPDSKHFDSVIVDFEQATIDVIQYFRQQNIKDIGFIGATNLVPSSGETVKEYRHATFVKTMKEMKLYKEEWVKIGVFSVDDGYRLMKELLQESVQPKAVFASSDAMAIGAYRAVEEFGLMVGKDIKIVGFDDIPTAIYISPSLSSVTVSTEVMGQHAVYLLYDQFLNGRQTPITAVLPTEMVIRKSSE